MTVGLRQALRLNRASGVGAPIAPELASRYAASDVLTTAITGDWLGLDPETYPCTRVEAMGVPAYARARHLIVGTGAGCPLIRTVDGAPAAPAPWMFATSGPVSPWHRMLWTLDDLIFSGWSLWAVEREGGYLTAADRVPVELWAFGTDGRTVEVAGQPVTAAEVVLIPGPHEGVLTYAQRSIRQAARLERSAARHAGNPVPSVELHQEVDVELTETERDSMLADWRAARASDGGAVAFTPFGVRAYAMGQVPEQLLVEGRNAAAVDAARHVGIPAAMLDATTAGASLTYETTEGRGYQFLDYGVAMYLDAIAARLSLDDVLPPGEGSRFDTSNVTELSRDAVSPGTGPD